MDVYVLEFISPNLIPNLPFFIKMSKCDIFIILSYVDFEKNNFQNRYLLNESDKWVTKSVKSGKGFIIDKQYADGSYLFPINMAWIHAIRRTLNIKTKIEFDYPTELKKTDRLIDLIKHYNGTTYVTNPSAKDKYLDEDLMRKAGIEIEYCNVPKHLQIHTFEAFEKFGIDGTIKQLQKVKDERLADVLQLSK